MTDADRWRDTNVDAALASWTNVINDARITQRLNELAVQDQNLHTALGQLGTASGRIVTEIIGRGRGGPKAMHGFIAEVAEVGISNARQAVVGAAPSSVWLNDNGPADILRGVVLIQLKFVQAGGRFSLQAVADHAAQYPQFAVTGIYQIPRDHYRIVKYLAEMPWDEARLLSKSGGGPSLHDWEYVHTWLKETGLSLDSLEPSLLDYEQVQADAIHYTLAQEEHNLRDADRQRRVEINQRHQPSFNEGARVAGVAAAVEGGVTLVAAILAKRNQGIKIVDFTADDWADIGQQAGLSTLKGGVRGASIYALTNLAKSPVFLAGGLVTVAIGVAEQAHEMRVGRLDPTQFVQNAEALCLETAVSVMSSAIGEAIIPLPILGAVLGNTVGVMLYRIGRDALNDAEQKLLEDYRAQQGIADAELERTLHELEEGLNSFLDLLEAAFVPDVHQAFEGSIALALSVGVAPDAVLKTQQEVIDYFTQ